jgi:hypothetical protein
MYNRMAVYKGNISIIFNKNWKKKKKKKKKKREREREQRRRLYMKVYMKMRKRRGYYLHIINRKKKKKNCVKMENTKILFHASLIKPNLMNKSMIPLNLHFLKPHSPAPYPHENPMKKPPSNSSSRC